ncbi:MAG: CsbD family protein [Streptosporangiaceae bacterium]
MANEDKAAHKVTEVKGKIKEGVGQATDDEELEAEGHADQAKGNLKQAGDKIKDALQE